MRAYSKYAVAASVVAVAIIGPASLYYKRTETYDGPVTGLQGLQNFSGSSSDADREERPAAEPRKMAAKKPVALPAPVPSKTKPPQVVKTAKLKPDDKSASAYLGLGREDDANSTADQKVARTENITPPASGRLKQLGELYDNSARSLEAGKGLGAAGGNGQSWTRSSGERGPNRPTDGLGAVGNYSSGTVAQTQPAPGFGDGSQTPDRTSRSSREHRDKFEVAPSSPIKQVATNPVSTFSLDVDTASYAFMRRALNAGRLPQKNAVRVEELVNYFNYAYAPPESADVPFKVEANVVPSPWRTGNKLVHLSVKGYELSSAERPPANLVFLIDVSGSMTSADKLPLVKSALLMLVNELKPDDTIGIVTYASGTAVALQPTKVKEKFKVLSVIGALRSGGSTAGAQGIHDAYRLAEANFDPQGVNRIILATDGDFNVGITNREELKGYIEHKRKSGVFLSILGVGQGNYNDALMQTLAQNGNGTASYIDTLNEARKVLVDEASSTLFAIAKDVKVQVEFNPERVQSYRLIGYETRALKREDFNNDRVDAGEVGSGHSVTAIYEITPVGAPSDVDPLRYGESKTAPVVQVDPDAEYGFVKLRYKLPNETASKLISQAITPSEEASRIDMAPQDAQFSIAVAGFGQLLRGNPSLNDFSYDDVIELARRTKGVDQFGYRSEFINLVRNAKSATR